MWFKLRYIGAVQGGPRRGARLHDTFWAISRPVTHTLTLFVRPLFCITLNILTFVSLAPFFRHTRSWPAWCQSFLLVSTPLSVWTTFPIFYAIFMINHRIIIGNVAATLIQAHEKLAMHDEGAATLSIYSLFYSLFCSHISVYMREAGNARWGCGNVAPPYAQGCDLSWDYSNVIAHDTSQPWAYGYSPFHSYISVYMR